MSGRRDGIIPDIFDELEVGITLHDAETGTILDVNSRLEELYGYTTAELRDMEVADYSVDGETYTQPEAERRISQAAAGEPQTFDWHVETATGDQIWVRVHLTRVILDDEPYVIAEIREITAQKEREQARRENERRFEAVFEDPQMMVALLAPDGTLRRANQTALNRIDATAEEVLGEPFPETPWWSDELADDVQSWIDRATDGAYVEYDIDVTDGGGTEYSISGTVRPVTEDEMVTSLVVSARDITDRRKREQELARQNERLDKFASMVSHDLRNPLQVAKERLAAAAEETDCTHFENIARAHDRMETIIEETLTLAQQGETIDDPEPLDLNAAIEMWWQQSETHGATLKTEPLPTVLCDASRLQHVFENLFRNAATHADDPRVEVGTIEGGIYIADDGPGIPDDQKEAVFDAGHSTAEGGAGFGLTIVKEVLDAHGWEITITDSDSGGARFEVAGIETVG